MEPNIPNPEILFSRVCNPGVLYTHSPCLGVWGKDSKKGVRGGGAPKNFFWDICWPTVLQTHGIVLNVVFCHCVSPIKESIIK